MLVVYDSWSRDDETPMSSAWNNAVMKLLLQRRKLCQNGRRWWLFKSYYDMSSSYFFFQCALPRDFLECWVQISVASCKMPLMRMQSSNWTSDLFSTYSYIFNVNSACWHLIISRIRGLAPLKISLINKYRHRIDVQNILWNRSIRTHGRSYIWGNRGARLGCFHDCCLSDYFDQLNFTFENHYYIAVIIS